MGILENIPTFQHLPDEDFCLGPAMFEYFDTSSKRRGLKLELKRVQVDHELNKTVMTFPNIRIVFIEQELDGAKIASEKVGREKNNLLEERKTLKENFQNQSSKLVRGEDELNILKVDLRDDLLFRYQGFENMNEQVCYM